MRSFHGNFGVLVRAYTYIRMLGPHGLRAVAENAVLNANYLQARLKGVYPVPHGDRLCMHEFVAQGKLPGGARHPGPGHRQAAHRPRVPPADELLPAHRAVHEILHAWGTNGVLTRIWFLLAPAVDYAVYRGLRHL